MKDSNVRHAKDAKHRDENYGGTKFLRKPMRPEDLCVGSVEQQVSTTIVSPLELPKTFKEETAMKPNFHQRLPIKNIYRFKLADSVKMELMRQEIFKKIGGEIQIGSRFLERKSYPVKSEETSNIQVAVKRNYSKQPSPQRNQTKPLVTTVEISKKFKINKTQGNSKPDKTNNNIQKLLKTSTSIKNLSNLQIENVLQSNPLAYPVILPYSDKNGPRKYCREHLLLQLMYGIRVQPLEKDEVICNPVRIIVGEGNNHRLVYQMLKEKGNIVSESFYSKSNFQWTQLHLKQLVSTPINSAKRSNYMLLAQSQELCNLDFREPDSLTSGILDSKVFRYSSHKLVKELFQCTVRTGFLHLHNTSNLAIINHVRGLGCISQKSNLFETLSRYAKTKKFHVFQLVPKTFLIRASTFEDDIWKLLMAKMSQDPLFQDPLIVKPGENSNRGNAISMAYNEAELRKQTEQIVKHKKSCSSALVQFYISNPLLYQGRKFDIRCYGLVVRHPLRVSFYWYLDGYARTSSYTYDVKDRANTMVHLTNEAIQIQSK